MTHTPKQVITRFATIVGLAGLLSTGSVARADHQSYRYEGKCLGFHGEEHMIQSLVYMDKAATADCRQTEIRAASKARDEVNRAVREVCSQDAKKTLYGAVRSLNRFIGSSEICHLDEAAERVQRALLYERTVHSVMNGPPRSGRGGYNHGHARDRRAELDHGYGAQGDFHGHDVFRHDTYRLDPREMDCFDYRNDRHVERFSWPMPGGRIRIGFSF